MAGLAGDGCRLEIGQQLGNRSAQKGMDEFGGDVGQGCEHEAALMQARMGQDQVGAIADPVTAEQQVQVQRARPVGHLAPSAQALLD